MRTALTLIAALSLSGSLAAQSHGTTGHAAPQAHDTKPAPAPPAQAQPAPAQPAAAAPKAPAATPAPTLGKPRAVSASEAAARIAAALESMERPGSPAAPRAARPAAPRYRLKWPSDEARWRLTWSEQDRVTLTWHP